MMTDEMHGSLLCDAYIMDTMGIGLAARYIARVDFWGKSFCGFRL